MFGSYWLSLTGKVLFEIVFMTCVVLASASFGWFLMSYLVLFGFASTIIALALIGISVNKTERYEEVAKTNFDRVLKSGRKDYALRVLNRGYGFLWSTSSSMVYVIAGLIGMNMTGSIAFFVVSFLFALGTHLIVQYGYQVIRYFHKEDLVAVLNGER